MYYVKSMTCHLKEISLKSLKKQYRFVNKDDNGYKRMKFSNRKNFVLTG